MTTALHPRAEPSHAADNGSAAPPVGPLGAVLRHPFLALLPVVLMVAAAIAAGTMREPVYTAEARVGVGSLSPAGAAASASTDTNEQLAATYARAISSGAVVRRVSQRTGLSPGEVRSRLGASPVPESPVFKIEGTAPNERDAITLTRAGTAAIKRYVAGLTGTGGGEALLREFQDAQLAASEAKARLVDAEELGGRRELKAEAAYETALLKAKALRAEYVEETRGSGGEPVRVVSAADHASGDSDQKLRFYVVAGALGGIALGIALATSRAAAKRRRVLHGRFARA
jgi:uncharacterized protein involved in exopolysaccharide biosynthesis